MFKITENCIECGTCEAGCPVSAIMNNGDGYIIDSSICINCGTCKDNCPVEAIIEE